MSTKDRESSSSGKKIKTLSLTLDPYENALAVSYTTATTDPSTGQVSTKEPRETKVRLKTIKASTDLGKLAKDII